MRYAETPNQAVIRKMPLEVDVASKQTIKQRIPVKKLKKKTEILSGKDILVNFGKAINKPLCDILKTSQN